MNSENSKFDNIYVNTTKNKRENDIFFSNLQDCEIKNITIFQEGVKLDQISV